MIKSQVIRTIILTGLFVLVGCAGPVKEPERTGFMSDYSRLELMQNNNLRFGLTEVDDTIGLLNVSIYTKISGLGLGGVSLEGEMVDFVTGEQLAAAIRWGSGSRVLRAGYTHTGDAEIQFDKWAKQIRQQIDEQHDR